MKKPGFALLMGCVSLTAALALTLSGCATSYAFPSENTPRGARVVDFFSKKAPVTLQELAQQADVVVCADVTRVLGEKESPVSSRSSIADTQRQFVEIKVREVLRGEGQVGQKLNVADGGMMIASNVDKPQVLDCEYTYYGEPLMQKGNRVLLFLSRSGTLSSGTAVPFYELAGMFNGKFFADRSGLYHPSLTLSSIDHEDPVCTLADPSPKTLEEIRAAIA